MNKIFLTFVVLSLVMGITAPAGAVTNIDNTWYKTVTGMALPLPDVNTFAFSPNYAIDGVVYAGTAVGVYKSSNYGQNWTLSSTGLGNSNVNCLAVSPQYASDHSLVAGTSNGVYLSDNYAGSWTDISGSIGDKNILAIAFHPGYDHSTFAVITAGTWGSGVYVSENTSPPFSSWVQLGTGLDGQRVRALVFTPGYTSDTLGSLYAGVDKSGGTNGGVYVNVKGSASWVELNTGLTGTNLDVYALAVSPNYLVDHTLFAGLYAGDGVYRSTNSGSTWSALPDTANLYVQSLAISRHYAQDGIVFLGEDGSGVFMTRNGGTTWSELNQGFGGNKSILALDIPPGQPDIPFPVFAGAFGDGVWQMRYSHYYIFVPFVRK